jgi:pyrimidine operon attenuation protein/uracil phosphoribosyltransferase
MTHDHVVLTGDEVARALRRIAHEIAERNPDPPAPAVVGIHRRGAILAERLRDELQGLFEGDGPIPLGDLDIAFYRDDLTLRAGAPVVHATHLEFPIDGRTVVIVDDVLYTGRTVRAAIEALFDYGRPGRVQLAVLADRGHRELPIRPDYVGKNLPTARGERVNVSVREIDGLDQVTISRHDPAAAANEIQAQAGPRAQAEAEPRAQAQARTTNGSRPAAATTDPRATS